MNSAAQSSAHAHSAANRVRSGSRHLENLTKAAQTASLLSDDIRTAHKASCEGELLLEIHLRQLISEVVNIQKRLEELERCYKVND
jgi:hypothetical protein